MFRGQLFLWTRNEPWIHSGDIRDIPKSGFPEIVHFEIPTCLKKKYEKITHNTPVFLLQMDPG